jgi:type IV secretory pathway VirB2 component (pilin)
MNTRLRLRRGVSMTPFVVLAALLPATASAQPGGGGSPWENAAKNLETTFTGPLAESLALVAIVVAGLMWMFGEAGSKRQIAGVVFGGGLALLATTFLRWLF